MTPEEIRRFEDLQKLVQSYTSELTWKKQAILGDNLGRLIEVCERAVKEKKLLLLKLTKMYKKIGGKA